MMENDLKKSDIEKYLKSLGMIEVSSDCWTVPNDGSDSFYGIIEIGTKYIRYATRYDIRCNEEKYYIDWDPSKDAKITYHLLPKDIVFSILNEIYKMAKEALNELKLKKAESDFEIQT